VAETRRRPASGPPPSAELSSATRLAFLDRLHTCTVEVDCAEDTLAWLRALGAVHCGLVATLDTEQSRLVLLAAQGFAPGAADALLTDERLLPHLVNLAYEGGAPQRLRPMAPSRPFSVVRDLHALPLGPLGGEAGTALGVVVAEITDPLGPAEVLVWATRILGHRLHSVGHNRLRAERERLAREKAWLDGALDAVIDPVLFTDPDGRILVANAAAERLLTVTDTSSEGRRRAVAMNNMIFSASLARTGGAAAAREMPLVDPIEGRDLLYEAISTPGEIRPGEFGVVTVLRDVTDLRRASEEIEENYRRLRAAEAEGRSERDRLSLVLASVAEPVLVTNAAGDIELMNPPAERLFTAGGAGSPETAQRVSLNDAMFSTFLGNLSASPATTWRGRLMLADPTTNLAMPMEAVAAEVRRGDGGPSAVVTILHDLTEALEKEALFEQVKRHSEELGARIREATAELAEQNELLRRQALELEQASAMKSQFLASISHELRTPLNAIIGYAHLLVDGTSGPITPAQAEKVRRLDANAQHLLALINDLLDLSRIEAGKMPIHLERFAIPALLDEVVAELEPLIQDKPGVDFGVAIEGPLPEIESDRQKVKQIIVNFLSNALKFTETGRVGIRAHRAAPDGVAIAVTDTGPGISDANQRRIFEAFAQAARPSPANGSLTRLRGTGLGLAICRRLAVVLGGEIGLESEVGRGSTFTLTLPRRTEPS
jgi:signal transduction histidine kinase